LPLGAEGVLDSPLPKPLGSTLYSRIGDLPLALMLAAIGLVALFHRARK
jgi:apolipoprotein N-acyltransferase